MTIYRATMSGLYVGQLIQNVVHFQSYAAVGPSCQALALDLKANWFTLLLPLQQSGMRWNAVTVNEVRNPVPMPAHVEPLNLVGGGTTESHSVSCFKVKWGTDVGGRSGFGKMFIGGINWALIQGGNVINQTGRDRLTAFLAGVEGRYEVRDSGAPVPWFIIVLPKDPSKPPKAVTSFSFMPGLGTQRRRNIGVGV